MNCFNVEVLPPSGTVLEIEKCTEQNLIITQCAVALPSDINDQINSYLNAGSGIILTQDNINNHLVISVSGDLGLTAEQVDDRVANLLVAGTGITLNYDDLNNFLSISTTGLQPSGNYSVVGHTHLSSDITDFNSSVSGLLPTISNSGNNRILTSTGSSVGINAENNATFDGTTLAVSGALIVDNVKIDNWYISSTTTGPNILGVDADTFWIETAGGSGNGAPRGSGGAVVFGTNNPTLFIANEDPTQCYAPEIKFMQGGPPYGEVKLSISSIDENNLNGFSTSVNYIESSFPLSIFEQSGSSGYILIGSEEGYVNLYNKVGIQKNSPEYTLDVYGSGNFSNGLYVNNIPVSVSGHTHTASQITDFNSSVSGLLPVKNISAGSGIGVTSVSGDFTVSVTGTFGLTGEEVDDRVSNLLVGGSYINLNYNDNANTLTINTSGLQPSGNYSLVGHTHISSDITDFNSAVSGLIPVTNTVGKSGIQVSVVSGVTEVSTNFIAGQGISLNYNYDESITISTITNNGFIQITDNITNNISIPNGYTIGTLSIYQNGVKLLDGIDYTAVDGSGVSFALPPSSGSYIEYSTSAAANNDVKNLYDTPIYNLGTLSGIVPINYNTDRAIQIFSIDTNTVTLTKGTGWPTTNISRDVVLQINCINPATLVWSIVGSNWYNQPVNPLPSGEYMVLLRAVGSGIIQGHYIGERKGSL